MSRRTTVGIGVFHDAATARRAIHEARACGFEGIHLVSDDLAVRAELSVEIAHDQHLLLRSPAAIAAVFLPRGEEGGLLMGTKETVVLDESDPGRRREHAVPRGRGDRAPDFRDRALRPGEILVVVEADTPARIAIAERLLRRERVALATG